MTPAVDLDAVFTALSHPLRRAMLDGLGDGERTVSEWAAPHALSLTGFMKHVRVLESAGLVTCSKSDRSVTCRLDPRPATQARDWLARREQAWSEGLDALGRHLYHRAEVTGSKKR